jgi:hypothetical protein
MFEYIHILHITKYPELTQSFQPHYVPGLDSASNRNEYHEYSWAERAAGVKDWQSHRHLWAECLESVGDSTSHNTMGPHGVLQG